MHCNDNLFVTGSHVSCKRAPHSRVFLSVPPQVSSAFDIKLTLHSRCILTILYLLFTGREFSKVREPGETSQPITDQYRCT